nr:hypothetical protein [Candidatus Sigynarchaeota archaeon]
MKFHYSLPAKLVLDPARSGRILNMLKDAGVAKVWLRGYFFGHFDASPVEQLADARELLERNGFETGAVSIPVGHPGRSDPDDPAFDMRIPPHWRYRMDRHGNPVYSCADIEPKMIADNVAAMKRLGELGFTAVFLDDDARAGNHGPELQGCFCDACIGEFNDTYHHDATRGALSAAIERRERAPVLTDWCRFISSKVTGFVKALSLTGIELGIMVMHRGDERHGIHIPDWNGYAKHLRVGEEHFNDRSFDPPRGKASEIASMQLHIAQMGFARIYSETTAYPARALSAENWVCKVKLAIAFGIPEIFLMGGMWIIDEDYWKKLGVALPKLRAIAGIIGDIIHPRVAPVHVAVGHDDFEIPWWPLLAGLPARAVLPGDTGNDGEILLVLGNATFDSAWQDRASKYKRVLFDANAATRNKKGLSPGIEWSLLERVPASLATLYARITPANREARLARKVRDALHAIDHAVPHVESGTDIFLAWIADKAVVIMCNLRKEPNSARLRYGTSVINIELGALEMAAVKLGAEELSVVQRA